MNLAALTAKMLARSPDTKCLRVGTTSVMVPLDDRQEMIDDGAGGGIKVSEKTVLVAVGSVPAVARQASVTYDGTAYTVREVLRQENGDWERWILVPST